MECNKYVSEVKIVCTVQYKHKKCLQNTYATNTLDQLQMIFSFKSLYKYSAVAYHYQYE